MDRSLSRKQVKLTTLENEPMARLTEQRLRVESIPCLVRSLGAGPGGWGVATNLPHAIYVKAADEMRAREILDLAPAEISEREGTSSLSPHRVSPFVLVMLIITAAALVLGTLELVLNPITR